MFEFLKYSGINNYSCSDLKKENWLVLREPIEEKYIKNLQYLNSDVVIDFNYDDYENIFKCIKFLDNKYKKITIRLNEKEKFNKAISKIDIKLFNLNKIEINQPTVITTLEDYICYENILYKMVKSAKNLSPLEKYIYAYNIVKNIKNVIVIKCILDNYIGYYLMII